MVPNDFYLYKIQLLQEGNEVPGKSICYFISDPEYKCVVYSVEVVMNRGIWKTGAGFFCVAFFSSKF